MLRLLLLCCVLVANACWAEEGENTFRVLFEEWYRDNPPATTVPGEREQALLERHRPRFYLAEDQTRFIDFYADYIGSGTLDTETQQFDAVDAALLNRHKMDVDARFVHAPSAPTAPPVAYARFDTGSFTSAGQRFDFEFLTYNLAFAHSGLPRGLPFWQRGLAGLINGNRDWHQLDHYVAATLALHQGELIAVTLQQHNYLTTWRVPEDIQTDSGGRLQFDIAMGSNELYPHSEGRTRHPTVSFVNADNVEFVMTGENKPLFGAFDITDGTEETDYSLVFLPPSDAFYGFRGTLGADRMLPGRGGPPGADYNTLPAIKPYATAMAVGWRGETPSEARAKLQALMDGWTVHPEGIQAAIDAFVRDTNLQP